MRDVLGGAFGRFLLPEGNVSLKLIFDNVRNYVIVGGILALGHWVRGGVTTGAAQKLQKYFLLDSTILSSLIFAIGAGLFLLNGAQTSKLLSSSLDVIYGWRLRQLARTEGALSWRNYLAQAILSVSIAVLYLSLTAAVSMVLIYVALFAEAGGKH